MFVSVLYWQEPKAEATKTETAAQPKPEEPKPEAQAAEVPDPEAPFLALGFQGPYYWVLWGSGAPVVR